MLSGEKTDRLHNCTLFIGGEVMSSSEVFSADEPDLNKFFKDLDLLKEDVYTAAASGLRSGGEMIRDRQKQLAGQISSHLPEKITCSGVKVSKNGALSVESGYTDFEDGWAVVGMVFEHGRPGQSSGRKNEKRYWSYRRLGKGKLISLAQKKGTIQPRPHIRRGFDEMVGAASGEVIKTVNSAVDRRLG